MQSSSGFNDKSVCAFNSSMHELTGSPTEVSPSKLRSPPPKPPRRRHSDQLSVTPSGTFPTSKKKPGDGNKSNLKDITPKMKNNKSGCGSLPANWTAGFHSTDDSTVHINQSSNILTSFVQSLNKKSYPSNGTFDKSAISSNENSNCSKKISSFIHSQDNQPYLAHFLKPESSNSCLKVYHNHHCVNGDVESTTESYDLPASSQNINDLHSLNIIQKDIHRRHHSDPLLFHVDHSQKILPVKSELSQSFIKNVNCNIKFWDSKNSTLLQENQCLHEEIKCLKEMNIKVWEQLCSVQSAFDNLENSSSDDQSPLSVSELLSQLYSAQKAKDCAMEERLKLAIEERDTLVAELEDMVLAIARGFEENDSVCTDDGASEKDKEIKDLLQEIERTQNPAELLQQQRMLLSYLYRSKEAKQDRLSHDLRLSLVERDNALEKVKKLEEELKYAKLCNNICHFDTKYWETSLMDILCQVIEQRDANVRKNDNLHEMKQCRGYRSPRSHKSSSDIQTNDSLQKLDQKLLAGSSDGNAVFKCFQPSSLDSKLCHQCSHDTPQDETKVLKEEIFVLTKALEDEIKRREYAEDKCLRLERLVNVLRKKINGQNVGVPL